MCLQSEDIDLAVPEESVPLSPDDQPLARKKRSRTKEGKSEKKKKKKRKNKVDSEPTSPVASSDDASPTQAGLRSPSTSA